jgi:hypothetical protein
MRIALLITTHERPEITDICFQGVQRGQYIFESLGLKLIPYIAVSDTPNLDVSKSYGFNIFLTKNEQIGRKHNELLEHAMNDDWAYMMQLGSDDLITDAGWLRLAACMIENRPAFGFNRMYFWKYNTAKMKYHIGNLIFGAGRTLRRDVVENTLEVFDTFWPDHQMRGLDGASASRFSRAWQIKRGNTLNVRGILAANVIDIKTATNINTWDRVQGRSVKYRKLTDEMP